MSLKPFTFSKNTLKLAALSVLGLTITLSSCKLDSPEPVEIAALTIVNAAPKASAIDFYLDNQRVNNAEFNFGSQIDYQRVFPGARKATVKVGGKTDVWYEKNIKLNAGMYYSLYVIENLDSLAYVVTEDEYTKPADGSAKVRFINLSPDAPELTLVVDADTTNFTRPYKLATPFKNIKVEANHKLTLKNKATGADVATLDNVKLTSGRFYTFWAKGLLNTTETNKKIEIKANKAM
ncbi:DUF4397 domain-containing protein [Pedobacter antarcticus]|uniref:DUF4397 domain-containing protein n=1 Tax=Pedobacter antarcticus TaxID=34086 RepID=UPI001C58223F|nr:DUF4397 domain-containing protein [Pedobacter antarcticus]